MEEVFKYSTVESKLNTHRETYCTTYVIRYWGDAKLSITWNWAASRVPFVPANLEIAALTKRNIAHTDDLWVLFLVPDATNYAHYVFNTIKQKQAGKINFEVSYLGKSPTERFNISNC